MSKTALEEVMMRLCFPSFAILALALSVFSAACGEESASVTKDADGATGSDTTPRSILLAEDNNYSYESALHIPQVETAASPDIEICWDDLRLDLQCHETDPIADINNVALIRIRNLTETEIETALSEGSLQQSNIDGYLERHTDGVGTCVSLADFSFFGSQVDIEEEYVASDVNKYLLVLTTGTVWGVGARIMTFLTPTESSSVTAVNVAENGCDMLDFSADLTSLEAVNVPMDEPLVLDWSSIARSGITRAMLGYYEGMTAEDLESQALDLMIIADSKWEIEVERGRTIALRDLTNENGDSFEQFNSDGAWVFILMCDTCQNPAPPFLTLLRPQ